MNRCITMFFCSTLFFSSSIVFSQDEEKKPSVDEAMAKIAALGPGVTNVVKDKKGRIMSCVVVGSARISTVLGKAKGIELARDKANLACSAEFVKWLKEDVSAVKLDDEEAVVLVEGSEEGDDESLKESGKTIEKSSKKMESVSKGLVRGLQILYKEVDGDGKNYTIIKGWKADTADGVKKISADLASDEPESKVAKTKKSSSDTATDKPTPKKIDKEIESNSATSDDAADFLPKAKK